MEWLNLYLLGSVILLAAVTVAYEVLATPKWLVVKAVRSTALRIDYGFDVMAIERELLTFDLFLHVTSPVDIPPRNDPSIQSIRQYCGNGTNATAMHDT